MAKKKTKKPDPQPERKQECLGCGSTDYKGEIRYCPRCGTSKCSNCDMGDDVECPSCPPDDESEDDDGEEETEDEEGGDD